MWSDQGGRWVWNDDAAETHEGAHPSSHRVLDQTIGMDGGGHPGVAPLPVFDAGEQSAPGVETTQHLTAVTEAPETAVCDHCGSVVARDRLRG